MSQILVIGDSHSSIFTKINLPSSDNLHVVPMNSVTMHRIGRDAELSSLLNGEIINNLDIVMTTFGEVDIRAHVAKQLSYGRLLEEILSTLVTAYIRDLTRVHKLNTALSIGVIGVVPPIPKQTHPSRYENVSYKEHPYPFRGTDTERKEWTIEINRLLKNACYSENFFFLDMYGLYQGADGYLQYEQSDGSVHVADPSPLQAWFNALIESEPQSQRSFSA